MSLLLWAAISATVYISTFKDDFDKEHIDKVLTFAFIITVCIFLLSALLSI